MSESQHVDGRWANPVQYSEQIQAVSLQIQAVSLQIQAVSLQIQAVSLQIQTVSLQILNRFDADHFDLFAFLCVLIPFTDWAHNTHSVFIEQSKNVYYVPSLHRLKKGYSLQTKPQHLGCKKMG